jgi:hypothetical protein
VTPGAIPNPAPLRKRSATFAPWIGSCSAALAAAVKNMSLLIGRTSGPPGFLGGPAIPVAGRRCPDIQGQVEPAGRVCDEGEHEL